MVGGAGNYPGLAIPIGAFMAGHMLLFPL